MAINKVGSKGIVDCSVAAADFAPGTVTDVKLNATQNLSSKTITLPNTSVTSGMLAGSIPNDKLANSSITASGTAVALGASITLNNEFIEWQSVITSNTTMVAGRGYFVNTTGGAVSMTLPASASIGDLVVIKDYAGTFATNNLTILRNSHNIQGVASDSKLSTNRASVVLVYVDATKGWLYTNEHNVASLENNVFVAATGGTVATSGDYKIHSFTGDGNFVVSAAAGEVAVVDYIVVAGGGAGAGIMGGGGGAGGYRESHSTPVSGPYTASPLATPTGIPVSSQTYPVTVGGGGAIGAPGGGYPAYGGTPGSNSVFSTITSAGGGGYANGCEPAGKGGSGAGKARYAGSGYAGNTPPVSPPQGNPGGDIPSRPSHADNIGAGGGGAGAAGGDANSDPYPTPSVYRAGPGGAGVTSHITGSPVTRAGGGGGGSRTSNTVAYANATAAGGAGGGGNGGFSPNGAQCNGVAGTAGSANTGGGGGGGLYHGPNLPAPFPQMPGQQDRCLPGGGGGKGIVIIRYKFQ